MVVFVSIRVMAPPGGATHINVFAESAPEAPKPVNKCQEERSKSSVFAGPDDMNPSRSPATAAPARQTSTSSHEDKADKHTATKVLAPPGGKSNFSIFGGSAEEAKPPGNIATHCVFFLALTLRTNCIQ